MSTPIPRSADWKHDGVRVVPGDRLDANTAQTPGMDRKAAINFARVGAQKLWAGTVHHHRVHAHQLEQHHVFGKVLLQRGIGHRVAAVLDDQRLAVELADVGQGLGQDLGLVAGRDVGEIVVRGGAHAARR